MARMVLHRSPVVVFRPGSTAAVGLYRGAELEDDDPLCAGGHEWLFEDAPPAEAVVSVSLDAPIEAGTAAPGEKRSTRRAKP